MEQEQELPKQVNENNEDNNVLEDFVWDDGEIFFGVKDEGIEDTPLNSIKPETAADSDPPINSEEDAEEELPVRKNKSKVKEDKVEDPFQDILEDDSASPEDKKAEGEEDDSVFFTTLAKELKDKGIFRLQDIGEEDEVSEDQFFELQEKEITSRVEESLEAFVQDMDDEGRAFLKFKKSGGDTRDFLRLYDSDISIESMDLSKDKDVDSIIRHYASTYDDLDSEEIEDKLAWLEDSGKKKSVAQKYYNKIKQIDEQKKEDLLLRAEQNHKIRSENITKFNQSLEEELNSTDSIGDFDFKKEEKKGLMEYMTKATVKVGTDKYVTKFQEDLGSIFRAEGDKKKSLLLLAKLVKTNFDVKDVAKNTQNKVVKKTKSTLQSAKAGVKASSTANSNTKSLADFF